VPDLLVRSRVHLYVEAASLVNLAADLARPSANLLDVCDGLIELCAFFPPLEFEFSIDLDLFSLTHVSRKTLSDSFPLSSYLGLVLIDK